MPWNQNDDQIVESKALSLAAAEKIALETPADPTVAIELQVQTHAGKRYLVPLIPLDVLETEMRIKHNTLKSGTKQLKANVSCVGSIPNGTAARVTSKDGITKEYTVKNNTVTRFGIGLDLRSGTVVEKPQGAKN